MKEPKFRPVDAAAGPDAGDLPVFAAATLALMVLRALAEWLLHRPWRLEALSDLWRGKPWID